MSELRVAFEGKGVGKAVSVKYGEKYPRLIVGNYDFYVCDLDIKDDIICFTVGHGYGCSDEFDEVKREFASKLPDTVINYYWHSTMSSMSGSYNIGLMDGEFYAWEDDNVYPYASITLKHEGIGNLLKCGEKDAAGFTHVWVNGKEFWLNDLRVDDDRIWFNNATKSKREYYGIEDEIAKVVDGHELIEENEDFLTGGINVYRITYKNGKTEREFIGYDDGFGVYEEADPWNEEFDG